MVVYNRDRAKAVELADHGAEVAKHPGELAREVHVVLSCLADGPAVEAVYLGTGNVVCSARPGTRIIELSTISPETSRQLHLAARQFDVAALDVAVSGSAPSAEAGALTPFAGGDRHVFQSVEAIFAAIAKQWFYMGPSDSGVAIKMVDTLLGVGMRALAEAVALSALFDTLAKTAVVAPAHAGKLATAKRHDYATQFPIRLMREVSDWFWPAAEQLGCVRIPPQQRHRFSGIV